MEVAVLLIAFLSLCLGCEQLSEAFILCSQPLIASMGHLQWLHTHYHVRRSKQSSWDGQRKKSVANPSKSTFRRLPTTRQSKSPTLLGIDQALIEDEHPKFEDSRDFRGADIAHVLL